jgi:hypothetical protein
MPDNLDEWIRAISYVVGACGGAVMSYGFWGMFKANWELHFPPEDKDE